LDGVTLAWMLAAGAWLDSCSPCRVATLGGHRVVVIVLASVALVTLVVLALLTEGFTRATPEEAGALAVARVVSLIASAGLVSLAFLGGFLLWLVTRVLAPPRLGRW
jgi:ABC-type transport system involved in cytochrome c biogenesis permease subunit